MLLQEEQYIIHWLTEYGALTKTQVVQDAGGSHAEGQAAPDGGEDHPGAEA